MALSFRRHRAESSASGVLQESTPDHRIVRELEHAAAKAYTGAVRVEDRRIGGVARIYVYLGQPYSVVIDGYQPDVVARLVASGALTGAQKDEIELGPHAGQSAVARGWTDVERLGSIHQELLLAAFGSVVTAERPHTAWEPDAVTDLWCTLPIEVGPLLNSVPVRAQRMAGTWQVLAPHLEPSTAVFLPTGAQLPDALQRPEFRMILAALAPGVGLDQAAGHSGFTRAEAVHLIGMLAGAQVVALAAGEHGLPSRDEFSVPEEFGERSVGVPDAEPAALVGPPADNDGAEPELSEEDAAALQEQRADLERELAEALAAERAAAMRVARVREELGRLTELPHGGSPSVEP